MKLETIKLYLSVFVIWFFVLGIFEILEGFFGGSSFDSRIFSPGLIILLIWSKKSIDKVDVGADATWL